MRIRRFFHRIWAGHKPTYRVHNGLFEPYLYYCTTCEAEDVAHRQAKLEKMIAKIEKYKAS
jgi:hypothetical protein